MARIKPATAGRRYSQQALEKIEANPELAFGKENVFAAAGKQLHALGLKECAPNS